MKKMTTIQFSRLEQFQIKSTDTQRNEFWKYSEGFLVSMDTLCSAMVLNAYGTNNIVTDYDNDGDIQIVITKAGNNSKFAKHIDLMTKEIPGR
jgi:hypothetical protein